MDLAANHLVERRLSDLLDKGEGRGPDVLFADAAAVAAAVATGSDPQLYYAVRDVLPSRVTTSGWTGGAVSWSADLVVYQGGTLPGGEPVRSIGHWNPADQLEIFQVFSGRVLLLSSVIGESSDESYVSFQECGAGDLAVVPFGAWHLTYVLDGPAMVFNIYSGPAGGDGSGINPAHNVSTKYRSQRGPAEITATRSGSGFDLTLSPQWRQACGDPVQVSCPSWLAAHMPPHGMLTDLHSSGSDAELDALLALAHKSSDAHPREAAELWR